MFKCKWIISSDFDSWAWDTGVLFKDEKLAPYAHEESV